MPVVVAKLKKSYLILDGHHRVKSFKELGIEKIPAVVFNNYFTRKVKVLAWYLLTNKISKDVLKMSRKVVYNKEKRITEVYIKDEFREKIVEVIKNKKFIASDEYEKSKPNYKYVIIREPFSKKEIVKRALHDKLFPPKSTRHKFKVNSNFNKVNYPLSISLKELMT